jgi:hypothetical protein
MTLLPEDATSVSLSSYVLIHAKIPQSHVTPLLAAKILFSGKAVKHLLGESISDLARSDVLAYFSPGVKWSHALRPAAWNYRDNFTKLMESISQELFVIHSDPDNAVLMLEELIEKIYSTISLHLWTMLKDRLGFRNYFKAIHSVYLLGKGEFFQSVLDAIVQETMSDEEASLTSVFWDDLLRSTAKSLSVDEDAITGFITLRSKQRGRFTMSFSRDSCDAEDVYLQGSAVSDGDRVVLCPLVIQEGEPSVAKNAASAEVVFNRMGAALFGEQRSTLGGFRVAVDFNLAVGAQLRQVSVDETDITLASVSIALGSAMRELELCLHKAASLKHAAVSAGVSFHGIKRYRSHRIQHQCRIFVNCGPVERTAEVDLDESFFLGR